MAFNLDEYVDVAERIRVFREKYPEGSLQSHVDFVNGGVLCVAEAYRTPDDIRPGVGHAFEPIPGKTPYTRDSEVMNAETSAWGRAIVALGFETKKIASREEVRNRTGPATGEGVNGGGNDPHRGVGDPGGASTSDDDPINEATLRQVEAFAKEHGTTWEEACWELQHEPNRVNVGQAKEVCAYILDQAALKAAS